MLANRKQNGEWVPRLPRPICDLVGTKLLEFLSRLESTNPGDVMDYEDKRSKIEEVFLEQFHYRSKWPFWMGVFFCIAFFVVMGKGTNDFQVLGLAFDAAGAFFLALGIVRGRSGLARDTRETRGRLGMSSSGGIHRAGLKANVADTINGLFGAALLLLGFTLQIFVPL